MAKLMTFAEENQFSFVCPIFNAETKLASCLKLREMKWMGKRIEKRLGCQVAMDCAKCPATAIVDQIVWGKHPQGTPDNYGSAVPVVGKLRADVLNKVRRTLLQDKRLSAYPISDTERQLLLTANDRIDEQLKTAPAGEGRFVSEHSSRVISDSSERPKPKRKAAQPPKPANDTIADAARTGDLSAAISAGA